MFIGASMELGEFESGMMASAFGLVPSVVLAAWARLFPALKRADGFPLSRPGLNRRVRA